MKIAHVSTFPPTRCGIAIYSSDLIDALPQHDHTKYALHSGRNATEEVAGHADASVPGELQRLAQDISSSGCDVVSLQHEFGIWGGANGENIAVFLESLSKPLVTTLHTTFNRGRRPQVQLYILRDLVGRSEAVFVLTDSSRSTLDRALGVKSDNVSVVPFGVPDLPYVRPMSVWSNEGGRTRRLSLCSIGFFRPNKGIEVIFEALRRLNAGGYEIDLTIAGEPQPQFAGQEAYLGSIRKLIRELDLADVVRVEARFLSRGEQVELVRRSHAGVFAYQDPDQASSGAIPLVMAAGRPVVCTPFEFARAKEWEVGGVTLAGGFGAEELAEALTRFGASAGDYLRGTKALFRHTRHWTWPKVGLVYSDAFRRVAAW